MLAARVKQKNDLNDKKGRDSNSSTTWCTAGGEANGGEPQKRYYVADTIDARS